MLVSDSADSVVSDTIDSVTIIIDVCDAVAASFNNFSVKITGYWPLFCYK